LVVSGEGRQATSHRPLRAEGIQCPRTPV